MIFKCKKCIQIKLREQQFDALNLVIDLQKGKVAEQQAELERLQKSLDIETTENMRLKNEVDTLKEFIKKKEGLIIKLSGMPVSEYNQKIESEAINKFTDKLKEAFSSTIFLTSNDKTTTVKEASKCIMNMLHNDIPKIIDRVKKKMVGDDNA